MRTRANGGTVLTSARELPLIRVTVLYETLEAALRAKALMDCVQSSMDVPVRFELECWRFDWLGERSLRSIALSTAGNCKLVIISTATSTPLPFEMERWLDAWSACHGDDCSALITLHSREQANRTRYSLLYDRLQRAARQKGVDFLCEFFEPRPSRLDLEAPPRADAETPFMPKAGGGRRWEYKPPSRQVVE